MALRQIRKNDDPILRTPCKEVKEVNSKIREILNDMADTMYNTGNGAGLAGNQVGLLKRLVVIDMGDGLIKLVNPKIIAQSGEQDCIEGCLSFPGRWGRTKRPAKVTVEALDENGKPFRIEGEGDMAKCLCHGLDHLDGRVFVEQVTEWLDI